MSAGRVYRLKDNTRYNHTDLGWHGHVGNWHVDLQPPLADQSGEGPSQPGPGPSTLQGLRTWRWRDESRAVLDQTNVYSIARPGTTARERDGLHQKEFSYPQLPPEKQEEPVTTARGGMVVLDRGTVALLGALRLPAYGDAAAGASTAAPGGAAAATAAGGPGGGGGGGSSGTGGGGGATVAPPGAVSPADMWAMELILKDGACRWGLALVYSASSGDLRKVTLIQEYDTEIDPSTPHVLSACAADILEARPLLPEDPRLWVTHGSAGRTLARLWPAEAGSADGASQLLLIDDDGLDLQDQAGPGGEWEPQGGAHTGGPTPSLLLRLPDAMYCRLPPSLRRGATPGHAPGAGAGHCEFEFGGWLRSTLRAAESVQGAVEGAPAGAAARCPGLQRLVLRYDAASGCFVDLSRQLFA